MTNEASDNPSLKTAASATASASELSSTTTAQGLSAAENEFCVALARRMETHRASAAEIDVVTQQLGRYPRGIVSIGARCVCGTPLAVVTRPLVEGKIPFPTTCYLTSPEAVKAMSHLEASGVMNAMNDELTQPQNEELRQAYQRAHQMYLAFRHELARLLGDSEDHIDGISAGGMPVRAKCLHALCAQSLVMGAGVNLLGDRALSLAAGEFSPSVCRCSVRLKR